MGLYRPTYIDAKSGKKKRSKIWWCSYTKVRRSIRESTRTRNKLEAQVFEDKRRGKVANGQRIMPSADRVMIDELLKEVEIDYINNDRDTLDIVKSRIKKWISPEFSGQPAQSITESDIEAFKAKLKRAGKSEATIDRFLAIVRRAYRIGIKRDRIHYGPVINFFRADNPRQGFFTAEQLELFCQHLPQDMEAPIRFAARSAWRTPSETLTRMWKHVNLEEGFVLLDPGEAKSKKARIFPFTSDLVAIFSWQWEIHQELLKKGRHIPYVFHHEGEPLFYKTKSRRVTPSSYFRECWTKACAEAKLIRFRHDLCRTGIRGMDQSGLSRYEGMALSGRKTESVYRRYNVVDEARLRTAVLKLEAHRNFKVFSK